MSSSWVLGVVGVGVVVVAVAVAVVVVVVVGAFLGPCRAQQEVFFILNFATSNITSSNNCTTDNSSNNATGP